MIGKRDEKLSGQQYLSGSVEVVVVSRRVRRTGLITREKKRRPAMA